MGIDRAATIAALRARVARLEHATRVAAEHPAIPIAPSVDAHLPGGAGLPRAALHEVAAAEMDGGPAYGLLLLLAARAGRTTLWIAPEPEVWPPGASRFGVDPASLVLVRAERRADALWAAEEALRCPAVGATVLLADRGVDLTASRRLQLAAEAGGGVGLLLIAPAALDAPSAARTRWRIAAVPSSSSAGHALGEATWRLELVKAAGGRPGVWTLAVDLERRELSPAVNEAAPADRHRHRRTTG